MTQFLKTTQIAIDGARTLPRRYYVDPEIFAQESERIFAQRWLCVGREDRIPKSGDYFLQPVGQESIIVLRETAQPRFPSGTVPRACGFWQPCEPSRHP